MAHEYGRLFFGIGMRGLRTSSQNGAKEGYNLEGREIPNFGKEFYELSFARAKTSLTRVQLTL